MSCLVEVCTHRVLSAMSYSYLVIILSIYLVTVKLFYSFDVKEKSSSSTVDWKIIKTIWRNDISLCVHAGQLTWCWSSDKAAVFSDARLLQTQQFMARRSQHSTSCDTSLDIRSVLRRPVTEKGCLSSSVSSGPKYTEDTLVFAFIPCNFICLCDFA